MFDDSALQPFHAWIPLAGPDPDETELHLSTDGETLELVFVASTGLGTVHRLLPVDFFELMAVATKNLRPRSGSREVR